MISVVPVSLFRSKISRMTRSLVSASRLPVGSSANNIFGSLEKALASDTRYCSPPESWAG
ncbi:hypothetical protein [Arcticibacter tournemirensis]|nr:hypothetical protein [Arcticibacter tournemirensis]